jgi:hypothetical protein
MAAVLVVLFEMVAWKSDTLLDKASVFFVCLARFSHLFRIEADYSLLTAVLRDWRSPAFSQCKDAGGEVFFCVGVMLLFPPEPRR